MKVATFALTWIFISLLCLNSYADDAQDLARAAEKGDISTVQALLAKGADVNAKLADGTTALIEASNGGTLDVVQLLIAKGADVNAKSVVGGTALMNASSSGRLNIVQALLAKGADVNAKPDTGMTSLMLASMNGYFYIVQTLIANGADVNAKIHSGFTALSLVHGRSDIAQILIKAGAKDVNNSGKIKAVTNNSDKLIDACQEGDISIVKALLAKGADVNAKNAYGMTPLMVASGSGVVSSVGDLYSVNRDNKHGDLHRHV